mmetsp:Transcript_2609/g.3806  ORF Transcript_2609/g.3806 Transcript_2609/m.3806 type:complete len:188 (+) Transcript_2609:2118-2681(+)
MIDDHSTSDQTPQQQPKAPTATQNPADATSDALRNSGSQLWSQFKKKEEELKLRALEREQQEQLLQQQLLEAEEERKREEEARKQRQREREEQERLEQERLEAEAQRKREEAREKAKLERASKAGTVQLTEQSDLMASFEMLNQSSMSAMDMSFFLGNQQQQDAFVETDELSDDHSDALRAALEDDV